MSKPIGIAAAIVLLTTPAIAAAKDELEPRVQAVLACESISSNEARLQCFDQSIPALKQALARGSMVLTERKGPLAREGVVKTSGQSGENRFWVVLENGDRWTIDAPSFSRKPPPPGTILKLKRTPFGNYWISGPKWPESEAKFVGHDPGLAPQ
jgi:hypothetical protein